MKRIISVICVAVTLIIGLCYSNQLLIKKTCYKKCEPFFNDNDQNFDVLFFGSSHVDNGVSPLFLYQKYGITSYNLAVGGNYIPSNCYRLQEVLRFLKKEKRQLPEIIVMDVYADQDSTYWLHLGWDDFSLSANKVQMTNTLVEEKDRAAMLFPFLLYHNRWSELEKDDFQTETNKFFGMNQGLYQLSYPDSEIINDFSEQAEVGSDITYYLDQMEEVCEMEGIKIIFIYIPYSYRPDLQRLANGICQYEEERGNLCINYMNVETQIDYDIDFFNAGHLNPAGAKIMTDELGKLLSEYGLKDHRGEPDAIQWEEAYEEYINFRISKIKEIQDVKSYLMAINDPDLVTTVQIREGMLNDIQISKLIERLGGGVENQVIITEEKPEIMSEDGQVKKYDVYCEVYRKDDYESIVHKIGFNL